MDLTELRVQLDGIDKEIVRLYEDRMDLCRQVGEYKLETGKRILRGTVSRGGSHRI